jgi:hypothetical protein
LLKRDKWDLTISWIRVKIVFSCGSAVECNVFQCVARPLNFGGSGDAHMHNIHVTYAKVGEGDEALIFNVFHAS